MQPGLMVPSSNSRHQQNTFLEKHTQERVWRKGGSVDFLKTGQKGRHRPGTIPRHIPDTDHEDIHFQSLQTFPAIKERQHPMRLLASPTYSCASVSVELAQKKRSGSSYKAWNEYNEWQKMCSRHCTKCKHTIH